MSLFGRRTVTTDIAPLPPLRVALNFSLEQFQGVEALRALWKLTPLKHHRVELEKSKRRLHFLELARDEAMRRVDFLKKKMRDQDLEGTSKTDAHAEAVKQEKLASDAEDLATANFNEISSEHQSYSLAADDMKNGDDDTNISTCEDNDSYSVDETTETHSITSTHSFDDTFDDDGTVVLDTAASTELYSFFIMLSPSQKEDFSPVWPAAEYALNAKNLKFEVYDKHADANETKRTDENGSNSG